LLKKKYLLVFATTPLKSTLAEEGLDMALALSALEQTISLLFMQSGIYLLLKNQDLSLASRKQFIDTFKALEWYDINDIYIDEDSLLKQPSSLEALTISPRIIPHRQLESFYNSFDIILRY